jgi:hypothetical protein
MAPAFSKFNVQNPSAFQGLKLPLPVVPLQPPELKEAKKGDYIKLQLKANPDDPTSEGYSINILLFGCGSASEWIEWQKTFDKVKNGLNLTQLESKYNMVRSLLKGEALRAFEIKSKDLGGVESLENFTYCIQAIAHTVFPQKAMARQKRYMHQALRKPNDMKIREYVA